MAPRFKPDDPRIAFLVKDYEARALQARDEAWALMHAIHSVYFLKYGEKIPRQHGSCVTLNIRDQYFLLSAAHVYEANGSYAVLVGCGETLHPLTGDRFSSKQGPSGKHHDDPVDAAVFHITCEVPSEIKESALSLEQLDLSPPDDLIDMHAALGYRSAKSTRSSKQVTSELDIYPSCEYDPSSYEEIKINRNTHVALVFEDEVFVNNKWQKSPSTNGMSGGAIVRLKGVPAMPFTKVDAAPTAMVSAIITERRKKTKSTFPILVGARVGYHVGLINNFLPEIFQYA
jgi:hypothetical protein